MGYGLFTSRKASLQSNINSLNSRLMQIQNEKNALTNKIANQQNINNMKSANYQAQLTSVFSSNIANGMSQTEALMNYQNALAQNSLTSTQNNMGISALQQKDQAYDTQISQLQTQLNAQSQELENVKKAEESAIKNSTVKYVG